MREPQRDGEHERRSNGPVVLTEADELKSNLSVGVEPMRDELSSGGKPDVRYHTSSHRLPHWSHKCCQMSNTDERRP